MDKTFNHIYFIDDDLCRKSLARLLTSAGHYVESFSSVPIFLDSAPVAHGKSQFEEKVDRE